jgi:hypothetical protein
MVETKKQGKRRKKKEIWGKIELLHFEAQIIDRRLELIYTSFSRI